jgi:hypothetical protein
MKTMLRVWVSRHEDCRHPEVVAEIEEMSGAYEEARRQFLAQKDVAGVKCAGVDKIGESGEKRVWRWKLDD